MYTCVKIVLDLIFIDTERLCTEWIHGTFVPEKGGISFSRTFVP